MYNLYRITPKIEPSYDEFGGFIVASESSTAALAKLKGWAIAMSDDKFRSIGMGLRVEDIDGYCNWEENYWPHAREQINVELIGTAAPEIREGIVFAWYNAG